MVEKAQFNPFAYQTSPLQPVQFRGAETGTPVSQPQEQFGYATRPVEKVPTPQELLTEAYDKNFVKDTFAYAGAMGPSTSMPEGRAYYDDSDYRGKMYYAA